MLIDLIDEMVDLREVGLVVGAHQIQRAHVKTCCLANNYQQQVLPDLHLPHKVLVIHDAYLEIIAVTKLVELSLKVIVEFIHATTEPVKEVLIGLLLELEVSCYVFVDLHVIF